MANSGEITVSNKTLIHVSEGIYRSVGSALKELVNNSFDANATKVVINTNYPTFDVLSIKDNGDGMDIEEFKRIVNGGIGDSIKSAVSNSSRPIIGRLGIGLLAIAQVCRGFTITSHVRESKKAFTGKMIFNPPINKNANEAKKKSDYPVGIWKASEISYNSDNDGLFLFTNDLRPSYKSRFTSPDNINKFRPVKFEDFYKNIIEEQFLPGVGKKKSIKEKGPYFELIWELCNLLPTPYYENGPIRNEYLDDISEYGDINPLEQLDKLQKSLLKFNFEVYLDNLRLRKLMKLPLPVLRDGHKQDCQLFSINYDKIVRGKKLKFWGYIFAQEYALYPRDVKGIQIRIKNVGIGLHDPSFFSYKRIEAPRDNWISGEIYVEEGLESALNIDRDSFNENDEHFYMLRKEIHNTLEKDVFPIVKKKLSARNRKKRDLKWELSVLMNKNKVINLFKKYFPGLSLQFSDSSHKITYIESKNTIDFPNCLITGRPSNRHKCFVISIIDLLSELPLDTIKKEDLYILFTRLMEITL